MDKISSINNVKLPKNHEGILVGALYVPKLRRCPKTPFDIYALELKHV